MYRFKDATWKQYQKIKSKRAWTAWIPRAGKIIKSSEARYFLSMFNQCTFTCFISVPFSINTFGLFQYAAATYPA